jgi:two-component system CheB/CheR fusion protein
VIVWELDAAGTIRTVSPAFESITGHSGKDAIGAAVAELFHPDDRQFAMAKNDLAWKGQTVPRYEARLRDRLDQWLDCEFLLVTKICDGGADRILCVLRDITAHKRAEKALELADELKRGKEEAERANRAKSEFLSSVSHEIRTPLTAILGFTDLLSEHSYIAKGPSEIQEHFGTIRQSGRFLLALIDDLLDLARIEAGKLRVECEPCSPTLIVSDAVESLKAKAIAKGLALSVELRGTIPPVIATDRWRVQQIIVNMLDNAIKFAERGTVQLTVSTDHDGAGEPVLRFAVADTGIGMTDGEMVELFQPFYRARAGDPGSPGGTGLGLAICKRIARRLGGDIVVDSVAGEGSTFTLSIPLCRPGQAETPFRLADQARTTVLPTFASAAPRLRARILVADDNQANRQLIGLRLRRAGADVVMANDGQEVLDRTREALEESRPFDAVVIDMQMPIVDGYDAVRQLRAEGFDRPIVAVTAYAMAEDREECLSAGCDEFISKPIEWDRFLAKLTGLLEAHEAAPG